METITHLFVHCPYIVPLWNYVQQYVDGNFESTNILFNRVVNHPGAKENCIVLIVKYYIYRSRCMWQKISIQACLNYIKEYYEIEYYIADCKNKLNTHSQKWSNV